MPGHQTDYRGYKIRAERDRQGWHVAVSPNKPDLPLMRHYSVRIQASSLDEAISNTRVRIDLLLDLLR